MSPCSLSQGHIIVTQPVKDISWTVLTALPQQCKEGTGPTAAQPTPSHKQNSSYPNEWTGSSWPLKRRDQKSKTNHFNMSDSWSRNVCASRSRPPFGACPWSVLPPWFRTWLSKTCKTGLTDSLAAMQIFILDWSKHFFTRQTCTQHATRKGFPQLWSTCCWRISLSCSLAFLFNSSSKAIQAWQCGWPSGGDVLDDLAFSCSSLNARVAVSIPWIIGLSLGSCTVIKLAAWSSLTSMAFLSAGFVRTWMPFMRNFSLPAACRFADLPSSAPVRAHGVKSRWAEKRAHDATLACFLLRAGESRHDRPHGPTTNARHRKTLGKPCNLCQLEFQPGNKHGCQNHRTLPSGASVGYGYGPASWRKKHSYKKGKH